MRYTEKAEVDGVGKAGAEVDAKADITYLKLHGYVDDEPQTETTAVKAPAATGVIKRARKPKVK